MSGSGVMVVTDSTACLPQDCVEEYGIQMIPHSLTWGSETYLDRVNIDPPTLYQRLRARKVMPITSPPSIKDFHSLFVGSACRAEPLAGIFVSSNLSATLHTARAARDLLPDSPICLFDSCSTALGLGLIVLAAARAAQAGGTLEEVAGAAKRLTSAMNVVFMVDSLDYLDRSGRIGDAAAWTHSELRIRPILHLVEGRIRRLARVRTRTQAIRRLLDVMTVRVAGAPTIYAAIFHANAPHDAICLRDEVTARFRCSEILVAEVSPTLAVQLGPGAVGIAFYQDGNVIR